MRKIITVVILLIGITFIVMSLVSTKKVEATCITYNVCSAFVIDYQVCRNSFPSCNGDYTSTCCDHEEGRCFNPPPIIGVYEACYSSFCCDYNPN